MNEGKKIDEDLIPDETMTLGKVDYNQKLRELATEKFETDYNLNVDTNEMVVVERSGYIAVQVSVQESNSKL